MIRTKRLTLHPILYSDLARLTSGGPTLFASLCADLPDPSVFALPARNEVPAILQALAAPIKPPHWGLYAIMRPRWFGPSDLVGLAAFLGPPNAKGFVGIAAAVRARFQGRGFLAEAKSAMSGCGLSRSGVTGVQGRADTEAEYAAFKRRPEHLCFSDEGTTINFRRLLYGEDTSQASRSR